MLFSNFSVLIQLVEFDVNVLRIDVKACIDSFDMRKLNCMSRPSDLFEHKNSK